VECGASSHRFQQPTGGVSRLHGFLAATRCKRARVSALRVITGAIAPVRSSLVRGSAAEGGPETPYGVTTNQGTRLINLVVARACACRPAESTASRRRLPEATWAALNRYEGCALQGAARERDCIDFLDTRKGGILSFLIGIISPSQKNRKISLDWVMGCGIVVNFSG
jgi:hypothetical protein